MNGITESRDSAGHYYVYDIEKEVFTEDRSDRKLEPPVKDRQGNRDYASGGKVFCQLNGEGQVKIFHHGSFFWDVLQLQLVKIRKDAGFGLGCCSGKQ